MTEPLLSVKRVSKHYGGIKAVDKASFELEPGRITGLIGPNGAGKTTMFDLITGHQRPDGGEIRFKGTHVDGLPPHRIARMGIGRTFQLVRLLPRLSALDNLVVAAPDHPGETVSAALFGGWREAEARARERAEAWLAFVGMSHRRDVRAGNLSYGQGKLTEIARALTFDADLLLLDEPMSGINPTLRKRLLELIHRIRREEGKTFLIVEHDIEMIMAECDDIIVMDQGRVLLHADPETVRKDERVIEAYLGTGRRKSFTASYQAAQEDGEDDKEAGPE